MVLGSIVLIRGSHHSCGGDEGDVDYRQIKFRSFEGRRLQNLNDV